MIIWKGWGILALIIPVAFSVLIGLGLEYFNGDGFYKNSSVAMPVAFVLAAGFVFWVGHLLAQKTGRVLIDPQSQEKIVLKEQHSMFWIPLRYWGIVLTVIAVWMYLANTGIIYK